MFAKMALVFSILGSLGAVLVSMQPNTFHYERSIVIKGAPEAIFPYLRNFTLGRQWNPYEKKDPQMKYIIKGPQEGLGSILEFEGNNDVGAGTLEIIKEEPLSKVEIRLLMTKPISADNLVVYSLVPEGPHTRMTWAMSGENGFLGKLLGLFINCEKMVTPDLEEGLKNLATIIEAPKGG